MDKGIDLLPDFLHFTNYLKATCQSSAPPVDRCGCIIVFVFALFVQAALLYKCTKILCNWIKSKKSISFHWNLTILFKRQPTQDAEDIVKTIPVICRTVLQDFHDETSLRNLLVLTLDPDRTLPPQLVLKSAIAWVLCDLILLLSRTNKYRQALPWNYRQPIAYRTLDHISHLMEKLAFDITHPRIAIPIFVQSPELLLLKQKSLIPCFLLDIQRIYTSLSDFFPMLMKPKFPAIKSKYDYNLEEYKRRYEFRGASCLRLIADESAKSKFLKFAATPQAETWRGGSPVEDIFDVAGVREEEEDGGNCARRRCLLSVTSLAALLNDPALNDDEKAFIMRRQMELRQIGSPKRWKWRSALNCLQQQMLKPPTYPKVDQCSSKRSRNSSKTISPSESSQTVILSD